MNLRQTILLTLTLALTLPLDLCAQEPVDTTETWTNAGNAGWVNGGDPEDVVVTNTAGYLNMAFLEQEKPVSKADTMRMDVDSGVLLTNISFRFRAADIYPSSARLYMHARRSKNAWYVNLAGVTVGEWVEYNVPVAFWAGWLIGPSSTETKFLRDIKSVDWVGLYIRRHGRTSAQNYGLDDFRAQGLAATGTVDISGTISYDGSQLGPVRIVAREYDGTGVWEITSADVGAYEITGLTALMDYNISAYRDSNTNGTTEFWEANGESDGNPVDVWLTDVSELNFPLNELEDGNGVPYWWLHTYLGVDEPGGYGGSGPTWPQQDFDSDGTDNYSEYVAGTDPTNAYSVFSIPRTTSVGTYDEVPVFWAETGQWYTQRVHRVESMVLNWEARPGREYRIYCATDLTSSWTDISGPISGDGSQKSFTNSVTDIEKRFYRIGVELEE